jgi:hypothetical protein
VDLGATATISRVVLNWEAAYGKAYQIQVSDDATSWTTIYAVTNGAGGVNDLAVSGSGRYVRMYGTARGTVYGYSLWEFQVYGTQVSIDATQLSQGKTATASSVEAAYVAANAVDGKAATRWSSAFSDAQWISVDLGATASISRVVLNWEAAYGKAYQVQVSDDAASWTTIHTVTNGTGGVNDLTVSGSGRYVRMYGTARGTRYGYSLWEFQVYGTGGGGGPPTCSTLPSVPTGVAASSVSSISVALSWNASTPGANCTITGYRVYQDGVQAAAPTETAASISGLAPGTTYSFAVAAVNAFGASAQSAALSVTTSASSGAPDFGPNVIIFDPSMSASAIQSRLDAIFAAQSSLDANSQFNSNRYALAFKPGTYNVFVNVGFYTEVLGLGQMPDQVHITNNIQSTAYLTSNNATCNFWRSLSNFWVTPASGTTQWAVSQAAPFRRMHMSGNMTLHQSYGWASGGFMADSRIDGTIDAGSQQRWLSRNSTWNAWNGAVWNMVFVGDNNAPAQSWPNPPVTTVAQTPIVREKPYLYIDDAGNYAVFVPSLRTNSQGITWASGATPGISLPIDQFYVAKSATDTAASINAALAAGKNLLLTPGIYDLDDTIQVTRANTVVLGMGFATLHPTNGKAAMSVADVDGVIVAGLLFDAGTVNSPTLLEVGPTGSSLSHAANPTILQDLFFRIGGAKAGLASVSLKINSNDVVGDHFWLWRADHGTGVSWTANAAANGLVVDGNNVTLYGLFAEHYQQYQVLWNGNGGRTYFYQSELPYDPPNQASWSNAGKNGWASYKVADAVTSHEAWGLGVYAVFTNAGISLSSAIETPVNSNVRFHDMTTLSLTANGQITNVINGGGGAALPSVGSRPQVTSYP